MRDIFITGEEKLKKFYADPKFIRFDPVSGTSGLSKKGYVLKGMYTNGPNVYWRKRDPKR
jgi:hypothetical protein